MEKVILDFILIFILVYLIYFLFIISRKKKMNKYRSSTEILFLEKKYKLNIDNINLRKLSHILALANAFIIALVFVVVSFIDNFIIKILIGFILLIPIILFVYHLIGKYFQKRSEKNV